MEQKKLLYTAKETAEMLNMELSTLYTHMRQGTIPFVKLGGKKMFSEKIIRDIVENGTK